MKVFEHIEEVRPFKNAVVTTGTFDGVHLGHQKILNRLTTIAEQIGGETVLLTFWPHPRLVVDPDFNLKLLSTIEEKVNLFSQFNIDNVIQVNFTDDFSNLTYEEYIRKVLVDTIGTKKLVIGYDHRFGKDRRGKFEDLVAKGDEFGYDVEEIPQQVIADLGISSTRTRKALLQGDIQTGNAYLGRRYSLSGIVVKGDGRGRILGFATANLRVESSYKLIPGDGSYAVFVKIQGDKFFHKGMMNIGLRPTVDGQNRVAEVHIFDFEQDIYGSRITIEFVQLIRWEKKFGSTSELASQLHKDQIQAQQILKTHTT